MNLKVELDKMSLTMTISGIEDLLDIQWDTVALKRGIFSRITSFTGIIPYRSEDNITTTMYMDISKEMDSIAEAIISKMYQYVNCLSLPFLTLDDITFIGRDALIITFRSYTALNPSTSV